jgi:tRNA 2-selenouridine synthase
MTEIIETVDRQSLARFEEVVDVRSPAEFDEDHIPGAINLPVLSNAERAEVGTIYVQESRLRARRIGAAYVARNIAAHLQGALADRTGAYAPLIYCWRGGQRSNAMATVLSQVGWRVSVIAGGYKTYRRHVTARLYDGTFAPGVVLLDGNTGSAKTEILGRLARQGAQTLDLEGLAEHRGSLFGALAGHAQPSQKMFESRLLTAMDALDPARAVLIEAESSKIGQRMIPPALWQAMVRAPRIEISAPAAERASYLVRAYRDIIDDPPSLEATLTRLPGRHGRKRLEAWIALARTRDYEALALDLIEAHYDPAYRRSRRTEDRPLLGVIAAPSLSDAGQEAIADQVRRLMASAVGPIGAESGLV